MHDAQPPLMPDLQATEEKPNEPDTVANNDSVVAKTTPSTGKPVLLGMGLAIIALVGVLIVMTFYRGAKSKTQESDEITKMKAELADLNRQRQVMGLSPMSSSSEAIDEIAGRLKKDADAIVDLSSSFKQIVTEKDAELSARMSELVRSEKLRQTLAIESGELRKELQKALVEGAEASRLSKDLADVKAQRDALSAELTDTRQQLQSMGKAVSSADFDDLKRRFEETLRAKEFFEARVKELEGDLSQAKLFASSETELVPAAQALFKGLVGLEGMKDSDITTSYSNLGVDLGASVLHTLNFATGSSALAASDEEIVRNLGADIPDGDLMFVVGYASKTGDVNANRALSSDRATAVAQYFNSVKRPGQLVQAVYLGQTDRFSSGVPERNQLVEIWRIRKK